MKPLPGLARPPLMLGILCLTIVLAGFAYGQTDEATDGGASPADATGERVAERKREQRREFQTQELMLAKSGGWIFKPGDTPRVLWRDIETVRRLGCTEPLQVRWFDAELNESPVPDASGRWLACSMRLTKRLRLGSRVRGSCSAS